MPPKTPTQSTFPVDNPVTPKAQTGRGHVVAGIATQPGNNLNNNNDGFIVPPLPTAARGVHETPANKGTAMSSQYNDGRAGRGLGDYITQDIRPTRRTFVHFMDFLKYLVKSCAKDSTADAADLLNKVVLHTTKVYNSDEFKDGRSALSEYSKAASKISSKDASSEEAGYEPLVNCVNKAFELLAKENIPELRELSDYKDLVAHDNHDKNITHIYPLHNKRSALKPDLCLVTKTLLDTLEKDADQKVTVKWSYTPCSAEVKLAGNAGFGDVVEKYVFKPGTDHVNEYFVHPERKLKKGPNCASKRLLVADKLTKPEKAFRVYKGHQNDSTKAVTSSSISAISESSTSQASSGISNISSGNNPLKRKAEGEPEGDAPHDRKRDNTNDMQPNEQIGMYGLEMLCRGIYTLHTTNLMIVDDIVYLWRYDRQNVIQSTGLNFFTDMPYFMALLAVFQRFKLEDWGIEPSLAPRGMFTDRNAQKNPVDIIFSNGVVASIVHPASDDLRYRGPVMKGRATCILDAKRVYDESQTDDGKAKESISAEDKAGVVIKASWPEKTRNNEVEVIEKAIEALGQSDDTKAMIKHLPKVIAWKEFTVSDTGEISEKLPVMPALNPGKPRILRLILFRRLEPLNDIHDEDVFMNVWLDCFRCHYALWNNGIRHGDISVWNMMRDTLGFGVLNDFDLAVVKSEDPSKEKRGGERTGTLPFMARDTLNLTFSDGEKPRTYAHEVECFIWVFAWLCLRHIEAKVAGGTLRDTEWRAGRDLRAVKDAKTEFINNGQKWLTAPYQKDGQWFKSPYENAGKKCVLLMELLDDIDGWKSKWTNKCKLPGEPDFAHDIFNRVIEVIEGDIDEIEENYDFDLRMMARIDAEFARVRKVRNPKTSVK